MELDSDVIKSCKKLQSQGIDIDAAHNDRGIMPQFDDAGSYLTRASKGEVNLSDVKVAMNEHKLQLLRWKKLAHNTPPCKSTAVELLRGVPLQIPCIFVDVSISNNPQKL